MTDRNHREGKKEQKMEAPNGQINSLDNVLRETTTKTEEEEINNFFLKK